VARPAAAAHRGGRGQDLAREAAVGRRECRDVRMVRLRDHQDVYGRLRHDVAERERRVRLVHDVRRDLTGDDAAEQAVSHLAMIFSPRVPGFRRQASPVVMIGTAR
jgi:hypothetical protein